MKRTKHLLTAVLLIAAAIAVHGAVDPGGSSRAASPKRVAVYPVAGTPAASTGTQITFRGITSRRSGPIRVYGSVSGAHAGKRRAHSDGRGFSFLPNRPFVPGERVSVRTRMKVIGGRGGDYSFRIGDMNPRPAGLRYKAPQSYPSPYRSRPDLAPPPIEVTRPARGTAPGYVFFGPKTAGAVIADNEGEPVWFRKMRSSGFGVQRYRGRPVLTWWQEPGRKGRYGTYKIADRRYRTIATVRAGNGYASDLHEFRLTPRGTAYVTAYRYVRANLSSVGGPASGAVLDSIAQEIDVKTGLVLWEWHSLGNVPLRDSYMPLPGSSGASWDYFHINSIADTPDGEVMISGRNTFAVYKIDRDTGRTLWQLGGKRSDFAQTPEARFAWQHAAVPNTDGTITLFDNSAVLGVSKPFRSQSRGITVAIDGEARTSRLVRSYTRPEPTLSNSQANTQVLPNGGAVVGWGPQPYVTEFDREGRPVFELRYESHAGSYRAFRSPWVGRPGGRPAIATESGGRDQVKAWVSWNGATEVSRWRLLSGPARGMLVPTSERDRQGFETAIAGTRLGAFMAVAALDARGREIGRSETVRVGRSAR